MSTVESEGELTVPAALAASKQKGQRKSAKGRKLMRWGPDEDQQLLLATEAVIIEGAVELDWNLVGEKMPQMVTGEAIKQHLYKVREARDSAGLFNPVKGEGKSAFGTRRGVTRYPPVNPDATPTPKTRSRPESKTPRGKARKAKGEDDEDADFTEKKSKTPSNIKHRSLLFGPAIPGAEISSAPAPAGSELIVKLSTKKRKVKEEVEEQGEAATTPTPKAPSKRAKKSKLTAEVNTENPSTYKKGRHHLISNFEPEARVAKLKRDREASQVLTPHQEDATAVKPTPELEVAVPTQKNNADVRTYFKPTAKKNFEAKPHKLAGATDAPLSTERALRTKADRPDYREDKASLFDGQQSELPEVEVDTKDGAYEPEMLADDESALTTSNDKKPAINAGLNIMVNSSSLVEGSGPESKQENALPEHKIFQSDFDNPPWPTEQVFAAPSPFAPEPAIFPLGNMNYPFEFTPGGYGQPAVTPDFHGLVQKPDDDRAWYRKFDDLVPTPAPAPASNGFYGWGGLPHSNQQESNTGFNNFNHFNNFNNFNSFNSFDNTSSYKLPTYNGSDELVEQPTGGQIGEGDQGFVEYSDAHFMDALEHGQEGEYELMQ